LTSLEHDIAKTLLAWHRKNRRVFPWRLNPNPYRVLVAEFFLQRTPANRVAEFYPSFLEEFTSPEKLATTDPIHLERLGRRLGLKKRMSWLVDSAKMLCREYGGEVPDKLDDLTKLPGVGLYTASAVLCFGFRRDTPIVDANVVRVLTRIFDLPKPQKAHNTAVQETARRLVPEGLAVAYNEALLDFAATVCKKRPLCDICPITNLCNYYQKMKPVRV